jgi:hypothetical protein
MLEERTRQLSPVDSRGFSVQAGAGIVFTDPPTEIRFGNLCAFGAVTGLEGVQYEFTNDDQELVTSPGCDPMAGTKHSNPLSLFYLLERELFIPLDPEDYITIDAELGGQTFSPGTYYSSSLTLATNTKVTLTGSGDFRFISGSTMITGANTEVVRENGSAQIEWAVTAAATIGASSVVRGSILAGAAITLGEKATVSGSVLALAAITLGAECVINSDLVDPSIIIAHA